jgi:hypothetical protein
VSSIDSVGEIMVVRSTFKDSMIKGTRPHRASFPRCVRLRYTNYLVAVDGTNTLLPSAL